MQVVHVRYSRFRACTLLRMIPGSRQVQRRLQAVHLTSAGRGSIPHIAVSRLCCTVMLLLMAQVIAYVSRVKDVTCDVDNSTFTLAQVEANDVRCPDQEAAKAMYKGTTALPRLGWGILH